VEYRTLGRTGIEVTDIGLGTWGIGGVSYKSGEPTGWTGSDMKKSMETIQKAWDLGVRLYDTADMYGRGKS
jgi:aryl-alcohol dehydrogenase-like predicted oxidoreductase